MRATPTTPHRQKGLSTSIEIDTSRSVPERRSMSHVVTPASTCGSSARSETEVGTPAGLPSYATPSRKTRHSAPLMPTIEEHSRTPSPTKLFAPVDINDDRVENRRSKLRWSQLNSEQALQILDFCSDNAARESLEFTANASDDVFGHRPSGSPPPADGDGLKFRQEPSQASPGATITPKSKLKIHIRTDRVPVTITSNNAQTFYPPEAALFCGNLPKNALDGHMEDNLEEALRMYGMCWAKVKRDVKGLPVGFVQFETKENATAALTGSVRIHGRKTRIEKAKAPRTLLFFAIDGHTMDDEEIRLALGLCGPLSAIQTPTPGDIATYNFPPFARLVTFAFYQDAIDAQATFRGHYQYRLQATHGQFKAGEVGPWGMPRMNPVVPPRSTINRGLDFLGAIMRCGPQHDRRRHARYNHNDWTIAEGLSGSSNTEWTQMNVMRGEAGRRPHVEDKNEWIYVSNIPNGTGVRELFEHFSAEGQIIGIAYITTLDPELMIQAVQQGLSSSYAIIRFSSRGSVQASIDSSNGANTNAGTALRVQPLANTRYWNYHTGAFSIRTVPNSVLEQVPARPGVFYPQTWQSDAYQPAYFGPPGPPPTGPLPPLPPGAARR